MDFSHLYSGASGQQLQVMVIFSAALKACHLESTGYEPGPVGFLGVFSSLFLTPETPPWLRGNSVNIRLVWAPGREGQTWMEGWWQIWRGLTEPLVSK